MKKYISYYWAAGGVVEFDTETGNVKPSADYEWMKAPHWGAAWKQNRKWFVLHFDEDSFILQNKKTKWRITSECKISLRQMFFLRNFKIILGNKIIFSIWYKPKYMFLSIFDAAYDSIDAESDDFFMHILSISELWSDKPFSEFKERIKEIIFFNNYIRTSI